METIVPLCMGTILICGTTIVVGFTFCLIVRGIMDTIELFMGEDE